MAITLSAIGYLLLGLSAIAVMLFCWLGVECQRGILRGAHHRRAIAGSSGRGLPHVPER